MIAYISDPSIVLLFPIWLLGYALFKLELINKTKFEHSYFKALISLMAILLIVFIGPEIRGVNTSVYWMSRTGFLGDYFDAIMFVIHLYFSPHIIHLIKPVLYRHEKIIRWSASLTFALYLFHRPIIQLIAAVYDGDKSNLIYRMIVVIVTFIIVATIGRWCELKKGVLKDAIHIRLKV